MSNEVEEINLGLVVIDYVKVWELAMHESEGDCRRRLWLALSTTGEVGARFVREKLEALQQVWVTITKTCSPSSVRLIRAAL